LASGEDFNRRAVGGIVRARLTIKTHGFHDQGFAWRGPL
jgi:hypothetical protein